MRRFVVGLIVALAVVAVLPLLASAADPTVTVTSNNSLGMILTDPAGKTLYIFKKDTPNTSNCYDTCAQNWPPLIIKSGQPVAPANLAGGLGTATRKDGSVQVTYQGQPLYYYIKDDEAGDIYGQGIGNVWFVVNPAALAAGTVLPATGHARSSVETIVLPLAALALAGTLGGITLRRRAHRA
ncbi:MAG TPA: hypothetical protein VFI42_04415 [Thermomicrobiaceae bacterium]|nr:hypothetical protein [Thermomicrobiaceae bacterium]